MSPWRLAFNDDSATFSEKNVSTSFDESVSYRMGNRDKCEFIQALRPMEEVFPEPAFLLLNSHVRIGVAKTGGDAQRQKVVIKIAWRTLRVPGAGIALRLRALAAQKTCENAGLCRALQGRRSAQISRNRKFGESGDRLSYAWNSYSNCVCGDVASTHICYRNKSGKHMLVASFSYFDPKRTTQDRKLMVKEPRTNGGPGSLSCWKGRSTAEPFHYRSLVWSPRSI